MTDKLVVTTSWDDGYPADLKLADLLAKYGVAGTFYVPTRNSEGRPVLTKGEVKRLSQGFEVGGHSTDHVVLTNLLPDEADRQIRSNKHWLEDVTGRGVTGFCYVRGRYNRNLKGRVKQAGFEYARTTQNLRLDVSRDAFEMPTTLQFYPHPTLVYLRSFVKGGLGEASPRLLWASLTSGNLERRIEALVELCRANGGYFHLWGHSWELEALNLWGMLEDVLRHLKAVSSPIEFLTNHEVHRKAKAAQTVSDSN